MLEKIAHGYGLLVIHAARLNEKTDKALKARCVRLVSWRVQVGLHIRKLYIE